MIMIHNLAMKQVHEDRQTFNCLFYEWELSQHGMDIIQTHKCLQEHLNASMYKAVLENVAMDNSWGNRFKQRYVLTCTKIGGKEQFRKLNSTLVNTSNGYFTQHLCA